MNSAQKASFVREALTAIKGRSDASTVSVAVREICDFADVEVLSSFYDAFLVEQAKSENTELVRGLKLARKALEIYADPTGYRDNKGVQYTCDDVVHPGSFAQQTIADLSAISAELGDKKLPLNASEESNDLARRILATELRRAGFEIMAEQAGRKTDAYAHIEPILRAMIVFSGHRLPMAPDEGGPPHILAPSLRP